MTRKALFPLLCLSASLFALSRASLPACGNHDTSDEKQQEEIKRLEGTWELVFAEHKGVVLFKAPDEALNGSWAKFSGRTYSINIRGVLQEEVAEFRLDVATNPKRMDFLPQKGENGGKTALAIYDLDGDSLMICHNRGEGGVHPKAFATKPDSPDILIKLKRTKPEKR